MPNFLRLSKKKAKSDSNDRSSTLLYALSSRWCCLSNLNSNQYCADADLYGVTCLLGYRTCSTYRISITTRVVHYGARANLNWFCKDHLLSGIFWPPQPFLFFDFERFRTSVPYVRNVPYRIVPYLYLTVRIIGRLSGTRADSNFCRTFLFATSFRGAPRSTIDYFYINGYIWAFQVVEILFNMEFCVFTWGCHCVEFLR